MGKTGKKEKTKKTTCEKKITWKWTYDGHLASILESRFNIYKIYMNLYVIQYDKDHNGGAL